MTNKNAVEHRVRRWLEEVLADQVRAVGHLRVGIMKQANLARTVEEEDVLGEMYHAWKAVRSAQRLVASLHVNGDVAANATGDGGQITFRDVVEALDDTR